MAGEQLKEALSLVQQAMEKINECIEEYGGEAPDSETPKDYAEESGGGKMEAMMALMGKKK